jgi:low affinity Fe/Cu permease
MRNAFRRFAHVASEAAGSPYAFLLAILGIVIWACLGPWTGYSDTWQLVVNTATTIITFLMVFLIQNMQNRDSSAVQLKLDELIRAVGSARNRLIDLEELSDEELEQLRKDFQKLSRQREQKKSTEESDAAVRQPTVEPSAN